MGLDFLPGSVMFDPAAGDTAAADLASAAVWFDSFVTNVDRTARNPNLLCWHKALHFIDHGAALYFHHDWGDIRVKARSRFPGIANHVLLPWANEIEAADATLRPRLSGEVLAAILKQVPDAWLVPESGASTSDDKRAGYLEFFAERLDAAPVFVEEALNARARLI